MSPLVPPPSDLGRRLFAAVEARPLAPVGELVELAGCDAADFWQAWPELEAAGVTKARDADGRWRFLAPVRFEP